jgi:tetratricopeptide (TPR) repeat protein
MAEVAHCPETQEFKGLQAWVQASSDAVLLRQLVVLFQTHRPGVVDDHVTADGVVTNATGAATAIKKWLTMNKTWLLFVEDARPTSTTLWAVLPDSGCGGCAVVTSQAALVDQPFTVRHKLQPITTDESVELLRRANVFSRHAPLAPENESEAELQLRCQTADAADVYIAPPPGSEKTKACKLRRRQIEDQLHEHCELRRPELRHFLETTLGNLPLSVATCSHIIRATAGAMSVLDVVDLYRKTHDLDIVDRKGRNPMMDTHLLGLSKSVQVAVTRLRDDDTIPKADREAALAVLTAVSVMDRAQTPTSVLLPDTRNLQGEALPLQILRSVVATMGKGHVDTEPVCQDPATLDRARDLCALYGLLQLPEDGDGTIGVMHQMHQRCLRQILITQHDVGIRVVRRVRGTLLNRFVYHQGASQPTRQLCWSLAPCVQAWCNNAREEGGPVAVKAKNDRLDYHLLSQWGLLALDADGNGTAAAEAYEATLAAYKRILPPDDAQTVITMSVLASAYERQGKRDKALKLEEEVLVLRRKKNPRDLSTALTLHNKADTLIQQDKYREALPFLKEALQIRKASVLPDNRAVAQTTGYLGRAYRHLGQPAKAHPLIAESARILESIDPTHEDYGTALIELGQSFVELGHPLLARNHFETALFIYRKRLSPTHPFVGTALIELGKGHEALEDHVDALVVWKEGLRVRRLCLPPDHPHLADAVLLVQNGEHSIKALCREKTDGPFNLIPPNTPVMVYGLPSAEDRNGCLARIKNFNPAKGRYRIVIEGGETLLCKPDNLVQLVTGVVVAAGPYKGRRGRIVDMDSANALFMVQLTCTADTIPLPPASVRLPNGTRVKLRSLRSQPHLNGQWAQLQGYEQGRYIVQVEEGGKQIKLKHENVFL